MVIVCFNLPGGGFISQKPGHVVVFNRAKEPTPGVMGIIPSIIREIKTQTVQGHAVGKRKVLGAGDHIGISITNAGIEGLIDLSLKPEHKKISFCGIRNPTTPDGMIQEELEIYHSQTSGCGNSPSVLIQEKHSKAHHEPGLVGGIDPNPTNQRGG